MGDDTAANLAATAGIQALEDEALGRGLHSSTFQLNLNRF